MNGDPVGHQLAIDDLRAHSVAQLVIVSAGFLPPLPGLSVVSDVFVFLIPYDQPAVIVQ